MDFKTINLRKTIRHERRYAFSSDDSNIVHQSRSTGIVTTVEIDLDCSWETNSHAISFLIYSSVIYEPEYHGDVATVFTTPTSSKNIQSFRNAMFSRIAGQKP